MEIIRASYDDAFFAMATLSIGNINRKFHFHDIEMVYVIESDKKLYEKYDVKHRYTHYNYTHYDQGWLTQLGNETYQFRPFNVKLSDYCLCGKMKYILESPNLNFYYKNLPLYIHKIPNAKLKIEHYIGRFTNSRHRQWKHIIPPQNFWIELPAKYVMVTEDHSYENDVYFCNNKDTCYYNFQGRVNNKWRTVAYDFSRQITMRFYDQDGDPLTYIQFNLPIFDRRHPLPVLPKLKYKRLIYKFMTYYKIIIRADDESIPDLEYFPFCSDYVSDGWGDNGDLAFF